MYKTARMGNGIEIWGPEVLEKFEIERPEQVIDYQ
jgi:DNA polymerase-1